MAATDRARRRKRGPISAIRTPAISDIAADGRYKYRFPSVSAEIGRSVAAKNAARNHMRPSSSTLLQSTNNPAHAKRSAMAPATHAAVVVGSLYNDSMGLS